MATYLTSGNDGYVADGGEIVHGLAGNDQIYIIHVDDSGGIGGLDFDYFAPAEIYGEQGNDYIVSYEFGDRLYGDSGNDTLSGGGGDDYLSGGSGDDVIWTGSSYNDDDINSGDVVWAGSGDDTVYLQSAHNGDTIRGEDGFDTLNLYNGQGHITQFSLLSGGSNGGLLASGFEVLNYYGSNNSEIVEGGNNADYISGGAGGDLISGQGGSDSLWGGDGADLINGGSGNDSIYGGDDADILNGQNGDDTINGDAGDDQINDGAGNDSVSGGLGNDTIRTGTGTDSVNAGDGNDIIREDGSDITTLTYMGHTLTWAGGDTLNGNGGNDDIRGGSGNDDISGGSGDDLLDGGSGVDSLNGGSGMDRFDFNSILDSQAGAERDVIADFTVVAGSGAAYVDRIDLSTIDAQEGSAGNQAFSFIGTGAFTAEGQIRVIQQGADTVVQINTSGAAGPDMAILLANFTANTLTAADFFL